MYSRILGLTISALILAYGTVGAFAQTQMTPQPDQQQMQTHPMMGQEGVGTMGGGMMRNMMGGGMMQSQSGKIQGCPMMGKTPPATNQPPVE